MWKKLGSCGRGHRRALLLKLGAAVRCGVLGVLGSRGQEEWMGRCTCDDDRGHLTRLFHQESRPASVAAGLLA